MNLLPVILGTPLFRRVFCVAAALGTLSLLPGCSFLFPLDPIFCDEGEICSADAGREGADAAAASRGFEVLYGTSEIDSISRRIRLEIQIVNRGQEDVDLSRLQVRYHFTVDGQAPSFQCNAVGATAPPSSCENLVAAFERQTPPSPRADHHLRLSFAPSAGTLKGFGARTSLMKLAILPATGDFDQSNDYSFGDVSVGPMAWPQITLYLDGALVFGQEP